MQNILMLNTAVNNHWSLKVDRDAFRLTTRSSQDRSCLRPWFNR